MWTGSRRSTPDECTHTALPPPRTPGDPTPSATPAVRPPTPGPDAEVEATPQAVATPESKGQVTPTLVASFFLSHFVRFTFPVPGVGVPRVASGVTHRRVATPSDGVHRTVHRLQGARPSAPVLVRPPARTRSSRLHRPVRPRPREPHTGGTLSARGEVRTPKMSGPSPVTGLRRHGTRVEVLVGGPPQVCLESEKGVRTKSSSPTLGLKRKGRTRVHRDDDQTGTFGTKILREGESLRSSEGTRPPAPCHRRVPLRPSVR